MEPITLATTAVALAAPYLIKTGEAIAEKIGEEIWTLIKKPFTKSNDTVINTTLSTIAEKEALIQELTEKINSDEAYKLELKQLVEKVQQNQPAVAQQVNNYGVVEKQVNAGNVGNINL